MSPRSRRAPCEELEDVVGNAASGAARIPAPTRFSRTHLDRTTSTTTVMDMRRLLRGMPIPPHGLPNTDGTILRTREVHVFFHPLVSVFKVHPLCPFTAKERFVVFFCSVAFNFVWTAFMEYHRGKIGVLFGGGRSGDGAADVLFRKNIVTTLYAVSSDRRHLPLLYGP